MRTALLIALTLLTLNAAGYMLVDGVVALATGDYITPSEGPHAGQLGPWSKVVGAVGIPPRSRFMMIVFVAYGIVWLTTLGGFLARHRLGWKALLVVTLGAVWYLPFGTVSSVLITAILATRPMRQWKVRGAP